MSQKWRPLLSYSSLPDLSYRRASQPFKPTLRFADHIFNPHQRPIQKPLFSKPPQRRPHQTHPFTSRHSKTIPPFSQSQICFRYGGRGHGAKSCKTPARCFSCGVQGHKRYNCPSLQSPAPKSLKSSVVFDDSYDLQMVSVLDSDSSMDIILLDPNVLRCYSPSRVERIEKEGFSSFAIVDAPIIEDEMVTKIFVEDHVMSSCVERIEMGDCLFDNIVAPIIEDVMVIEDIIEDPVMSHPGEQMVLDLSPIRAEDFADFLIIDDFEDYFSKEEELSNLHPVEHLVQCPEQPAFHH